MVKAKEFFIKNRLLINCCILAILFFVNCFWSGMVWIIYPILLLMVLVDKLENGFSCLIFTIPFCFISEFTSLLLFLIATTLFLVKYYIIVLFKQKIKVKKFGLIAFLIFFVYCFLPFGKYNQNFLYKLFFLMFILFSLWVFVNQHDVINLRKNNRILAIAIMISAAFGLTYFVSPFLQSTVEVIYVKNKLMRFQALMGHTNAFAVICELSIAISAYTLIKSRKWYDAVLLIVVALLGMLTFSKTYFSLLAFITLAVVIWLFKVDYKKAILFFLIVLAGIGLFVLIRPDVFEILHGRFFGPIKECKDLRDVLNMITTDRYDLWLEYLIYLGQHPVRLLFGSGLGALPLGTFSAHNAYISMLYQLGLIGTISFISVIIIVIKTRPRTEKKRNPAIIIPIIALLLIFCIEDVMFYII